MPELKCKNCGKTLSGRWKNYCCVRCGSLYYIKNNHRETDIEKKLREWLELNQISYEAQKTISNITVPDFVIGKTCLFADGDYFHSSRRRQYTDGRINKRLIKLGYRVIRYKGSDILKNFDRVTEDIKAKLGCATV